MLPKQYRLTKKKDFDTVFKRGEGVKNGFLICKIVKNNEAVSRFGFVVSKKISPKATIRNKVKRRLREAVFAVLPQVKKSVDVVIFTLPGIQKKEFAQIQEAVAQSFKKLRII